LDLGKVVIQMFNSSSKTREEVTKYKYMQKSKTQDGTKANAKISKKQANRGVGSCIGPDP
jgi:hypothetical protein